MSTALQVTGNKKVEIITFGEQIFAPQLPQSKKYHYEYRPQICMIFFKGLMMMIIISVAAHNKLHLNVSGSHGSFSKGDSWIHFLLICFLSVTCLNVKCKIYSTFTDDGAFNFEDTDFLKESGRENVKKHSNSWFCSQLSLKMSKLVPSDCKEETWCCRVKISVLIFKHVFQPSSCSNCSLISVFLPPAAPSLWERPNHSTTSKVAYFKRKYAEEEDLHGGLHGYFQKVRTCSFHLIKHILL